MWYAVIAMCAMREQRRCCAREHAYLAHVCIVLLCFGFVPAGTYAVVVQPQPADRSFF
jgi:hypothetical protein